MRLGQVGRGELWPATAWPGMAGSGLVWQGEVWYGEVWSGEVRYGEDTMNRAQLIAFRESIEAAIEERASLGEYDANSRYINHLLGLLAKLADHAISVSPRPGRKPKETEEVAE